MMEFDLTGKNALVTGASRGIGAAAAIALAKAGANVVVNYNRSVSAAREVAATIEKIGSRSTLIQADVSKKSDIDAMFDRMERDGELVDILVNNAGIEKRSKPTDFEELDYDAIFNTNLKGAFFCAQRAIRGMRIRRWGRVINISSVHEFSASGFSAPYSMTKSGMVMMTRELAKEYGKDGITVNNITPGAIRTDINREVLSQPNYEKQVLARIPVGFIAEPKDVVPLIVYLCSDLARYVTGASWVIDGGLTL